MAARFQSPVRPSRMARVFKQHTGKPPARYLHDVGAHVTLSNALGAGVEVKNVTDQETFDYARFPLPGRSYYGRLVWQF